MIFTAKNRSLLLIALLVALPARRAGALLNLDGTRNQVFIFGDVTYAYNSNLFSNANAQGDSSVTTEVGLDLKRRAGLIGVNVTAKVDYESFAKYTSQSAVDPSLVVEFNKSEGRTTGGLTVSFYRESRSDSAVNLRTSSWNLPVNLNVKYPINDRFYTTSTTDYLERHYIDNESLANLTDYSEALDLFYVYTSKLDFVGGYRIRFSHPTIGPDTYDHWFNIGAVGSLVAKLNGTVRIGYQIRQIAGGSSYGNLDAVAALNWTVTRKLTLSGEVSRDFTTIATGASVDATAVALRANYVFTRKFDVDGGVSYGRNDFIGGLPPQRKDHFYGWDVGARYKFNEHLRLAASYNYLHNYSTLSFSDFDRQGFTLDLSSRF